jgi:4-amino-4-deoxy-L-arabinose transferase-like glycosyltransferase
MVSSESVHNRHWHKAFTIYLPMLTAGAGLWIYSEIKLFFRRRLFDPRAVWRSMRGQGWGAFLLIWLLPALLIFFASRSRLELYVLPLYVPIVLAIAAGIHEDNQSDGIPTWLYAGVLVSGLLLVTGKGVVSYRFHDHNMRQMHDSLVQIMPKGAKVVAYDRTRFYGLQFYLDGKMARWSMEQDMPWADATVEEGMKLMANNPGQSYVLVLPAGSAAVADELFSEAGLPHERVEVPQGIFCIVKARR